MIKWKPKMQNQNEKKWLKVGNETKSKLKTTKNNKYEIHKRS